MSMCISTVRARTKCVAKFCLFRRSSCTASFFELCPCRVAGGRRGTFRTFWGLEHRFAWRAHDIGHFFIRVCRRGICSTLPKRWQVWVKMRGGFGGHFAWQAHHVVNLDGVLIGSKVSFVKRSSFWFWTWWWIHRCSTLDASGALLCRPRQKVAETKVKRRFWLFQCSFLVAQCFVKINMCSRNLVTLCVSNRYFHMARATFSALCACRIALVVAQCSF